MAFIELVLNQKYIRIRFDYRIIGIRSFLHAICSFEIRFSFKYEFIMIWEGKFIYL